VATRPRWRAVEQAELHQIGFVDFLDGIFFLADGSRNRAESDRAAGIFLQNREHEVAVDFVEAVLIDASICSASLATASVMWPCARTCAKSRARRSSRLATRGVPRLRRAISKAPSSSTAIPRIDAERRTIVTRSSGV
jgi:hypothetical protein